MKYKAILLLLTVLVASCTKQTPIDLVNSQLMEISGNKYELESSGCRPDYYIDGGHYFELPKLKDGLYLYYEDNNAQFPSLGFADDREGLMNIDELPLKDVRSIISQDSRLFVMTGLNQYLININSEGRPSVAVISKDNVQKSPEQITIEFKPVHWSTKVRNYKNNYISLADTSRVGYVKGQTPKIDCIKTLATYSLRDKDGVKTNYLIGESVYSYFLLKINTGQVQYIDEDQFVSYVMNAHNDGNIYFVDSIDYYLKKSEIQGLQYVKQYEYLGVQSIGSDSLLSHRISHGLHGNPP